ncbi:MAG: hypothetical protein NC924_09685 [Candidatus Omnitrophica bacterium]|nr:hypothetical protein [Candidatus Omnitrophota bacterium]
MSRCRKILGSMAVAVCALCVCAGAAVAAMLAVDTETLTAQAQVVVVGDVAETTAYWNEEKTMIFTNVDVAVSEVLKGDIAPGTLTVKVPGGKVGDYFKIVSIAPFFKKGETVLLFLNDDAAAGGLQKLTANIQGKFSIITDELTGEKQVVRSAGVLVQKNGAIVDERKMQVPLTAFTAQIRAYVAAKKTREQKDAQ